MFINFKKKKDRPVAVGGLVGGVGGGLVGGVGGGLVGGVGGGLVGGVGGGLVGGVGVVGGVGGLKESHNPHDLRQFGLI